MGGGGGREEVGIILGLRGRKCALGGGDGGIRRRIQTKKVSGHNPFNDILILDRQNGKCLII